MARLTVIPGGLRRADVLKARRLMHYRVWKGLPYVSKWPVARGKKKTELQQAWVDQFSSIARITPTMHPIESNNAKLWAGTTGFYWRDVLHRALIGKLFMDDGAVRVTTPTALVYSTIPQALTINVTTALQANAKRWDNYTWWASSPTPTRLTAKEPGLYLIGTWVTYPSDTTNWCEVSIRVNGTTFITTVNQRPGSTIKQAFAPTTIFYLEKGDYVEVTAFCSASGETAQLNSFWILAITPENVVNE